MFLGESNIGIIPWTLYEMESIVYKPPTKSAFLQSHIEVLRQQNHETPLALAQNH